MNCFFCNQSFNIKDLITHLRKYHDEIWRCGEDGCMRVFGRAFELTNHFKKAHSLLAQVNVTTPKPNSFIVKPTNNEIPELNTMLIPNVCVSNNTTFLDTQHAMNLSAKSFLLNLHTQPNLNRSQVSSIANSVVHFLINPLIEIYQHLQNASKSIQCEPLDHIKSSLITLSSEYNLTQMLTKEGQYIHPKKLIIDSSVQTVQHKHIMQYNAQEKKGSFVPMPELFKLFFELPNVFESTLNFMNTLNEKTELVNFVQGSYWKTKCSNHAGKLVIPFHLYFDDWEPDNALGSHRKLNSIAATYILFPTLPKHVSSLLENILVVQLFKSKDKLYGDSKTYINLVKECSALEKNGILLKINNKVIRVYFMLGLILGDNLGIHEILGFSKSFVANYCCRFCKVHRNDLHIKNSVNESLIRTKEGYESDLTLNNVSETGIVQDCIFNKINSFQVTTNYAVDIMHDMYEGVCHYDLGLVLNYLIYEKNLFTLNDFNDRKQMFSYGPAEVGNISQPILLKHIQDKKFQTSASEMRCIWNFFTLIIGDKVPKTDPV